GAQTFLTNAGAVVFLGNDQDVQALKYISDRIGPLRPDEVGEPFEPSDPEGPRKEAAKMFPIPPKEEWFAHHELFTNYKGVREETGHIEMSYMDKSDPRNPVRKSLKIQMA